MSFDPNGVFNVVEDLTDSTSCHAIESPLEGSLLLQGVPLFRCGLYTAEYLTNVAQGKDTHLAQAAALLATQVLLG
jgi:hypothetical protein